MIKPTKETPIPTGPEQFENSYAGQTILTKAGVQKTLVLKLERFRANADGTAPMTTGTPVSIVLIGPGKSADPKIKAAVDKYNAANEAAIQQLVTDLGD